VTSPPTSTPKQSTRQVIEKYVSMSNLDDVSGSPRLRTRTASSTPLPSTFPTTPSAQPVDYRHRILILAKEGVRKLGNSSFKKTEGRDLLVVDISSLRGEIDKLQVNLGKLQTKHASSKKQLADLNKEKDYQRNDRLLSAKSSPTSPTQPGGGVAESKAQLAYLNLQLQTLRKRKVTTEALIHTLEADKEQYSLEDIQATQTMLAGITSKIDELERQLEQVVVTSSLKLPPSPVPPRTPPSVSTPPPPPTSTSSQHTAFSGFASVTGLAMSRLSSFGLGSPSLKSGMDTSMRASTHGDTTERPYYNTPDIAAKVEAADAKIAHLDQEMRILQATLDAKKNKLTELEEELSLYEEEGEGKSELHALKEIVLYLSDDKKTLVSDVEAQWQVKDLLSKNAALSDELKNVKDRFSSVLGTMDNFSMSTFRVNQVSGESEDGAKQQSVSQTEEPSQEVGEEKSARNVSIAPPVVQVMKERINVKSSLAWSPNFIGAVNTWSRQGREVIFIISVRAVGDGVSEWTVMKTFNDFKTLRGHLKTYSNAIDSSFPGDYYSFFSLSDEAAEDRKEALNTYLLSVCGSQSIMTSEQGCIAVKSFLLIDENLGKRRRSDSKAAQLH